jgi:hypothetical protein
MQRPAALFASFILNPSPRNQREEALSARPDRPRVYLQATIPSARARHQNQQDTVGPARHAEQTDRQIWRTDKWAAPAAVERLFDGRAEAGAEGRQ